MDSFNDKSRVWSGVNGFWVIQNNAPLINRINKINKRNRAKSIMTFDFSTLYTKIPHNLLLEALNEIIEFAFKGGTSDAVYVTKHGASWRGSKNNIDQRAYKKCSIKSALKYVIENSFFHVGDITFRQTIGIPIGSDPAPFFANLFLYIYESKFLSELKKSDPTRARKFRHIFRFIDDLISLNDDSEFLRSYKDIYPPEMELKRENMNDTSATFLDLDLNILNKQISSNLFDKRDNFPFSVVRLPYRCSNMPSKMFFATISAEILCIGRATSQYYYFIHCVKNILTRTKKQGADSFGIQKVLRKMIDRHPESFLKFSKSTEEIVANCCSFRA